MSGVDSKFSVMSGVDLVKRVSSVGLAILSVGVGQHWFSRMSVSDGKSGLVSGVENTPFMGPNIIWKCTPPWVLLNRI